MRTAAIVYFASAIAVVGIDIDLTQSLGVGIGSATWLIVAGALVVLGRELLVGARSARRNALVVSSVTALAFAASGIVMLVYGGVENALSGPSGYRQIFIAFVIGALAHAIAVASLLSARRHAP